MTGVETYRIAQPNIDLMALVDESGCVVAQARRTGDGLWMIQGRCYIDREAVVRYWNHYHHIA